MPTFNEIITRATALGYPIAENEFVITKQTPPPTLPFICYQRIEHYKGTDDLVRLRTTEIALDFYTDRRLSESDIAKIAEFQRKVLFDLEYTKTQTFIREENMTQTAFDFSITEKIKI